MRTRVFQWLFSLGRCSASSPSFFSFFHLLLYGDTDGFVIERVCYVCRDDRPSQLDSFLYRCILRGGKKTSWAGELFASVSLHVPMVLRAAPPRVLDDSSKQELKKKTKKKTKIIFCLTASNVLSWLPSGRVHGLSLTQIYLFL